MIKIFMLIAAIAFLINFASFMTALINRFNVKRKMMMQGKNPNEDVPDFSDMCEVDEKIAKKYQVAIRIWMVSLIILVLSIIGAYLYK